MIMTAKLVADLTLVLRGMRAHEGVIDSHRSQVRSDTVDQHLRALAAREHVVADRLARVLHVLGAPAARARPSWLPSPVSIAAHAAVQAQPLGEALVAEATTVRMFADRARMAGRIAVAADESGAIDVSTQVAEFYDGYATWLVDTAAAIVVDPDTADLVPTTVQRIGGQVKAVVGAPARLYGKAADRTAAGLGEVTSRARGLVGLTTEKVDDTVRSGFETATETVGDAAAAVEDAVTPLQATDLPVTRYDSRSAAEAAKAVRGLATIEDVSNVVAYESRHKDRKTVIEAGDRRAAQLADASH